MRILEILCFLFFAASDWNDRFLHRKGLRLFFPVGAVLLFSVLTIQCARNPAPFRIWVRVLFLISFLFFSWLLLRALFLDLKSGEAYVSQETGRSVCRTGVYSLCRHPGVLFSAPLLFSLHFAFGLPFFDIILCFVLNLFLGLYEDFYIFPYVLNGWDDYKRTTPFLIPGFRKKDR